MQPVAGIFRTPPPLQWNRGALGAILLAVAIAHPALADRDPKGPRFAEEKISLSELNGFRVEVRSMPDVRCQDLAAAQTVCEAKVRNTVWVFTREGHPAHPAVSRRVTVLLQTASGNAVLVNRTGHYAGDALAFRAWMKEFAHADEQQVTAGKQSLDEQP